MKRTALIGGGSAAVSFLTVRPAMQPRPRVRLLSIGASRVQAGRPSPAR